MAFTVVYDACALHPAPLRDLLIRIANAEIVQARWSERILDECFSSILRQRPDLQAGALDRTRELMIRVVPDCLVTGYEPLEAGLVLPDPEDRHVLAAAIRSNAQVIVTFNLADFPAAVLATYDIEAKHPDNFLLDSIDIAPGAAVRCLTEQAAALRRPPQSVNDLLERLRQIGLVRTVGRFEEMLRG
jgi:predicted nucleic acid-binding protein